MKKKIFLYYAMFLISIVPVICLATPVPDTGQTNCYNNTRKIPYPQLGQDFYWQNAQYTTNHHSYTDLGNGVIQDKVAKLLLQDIVDSDNDGILDDGDMSGVAGDNPCTGGNTIFCDDNCPNVYNPDQSDVDGDGIGDACEHFEFTGTPVFSVAQDFYGNFLRYAFNIYFKNFAPNSTLTFFDPDMIKIDEFTADDFNGSADDNETYEVRSEFPTLKLGNYTAVYTGNDQTVSKVISIDAADVAASAPVIISPTENQTLTVGRPVFTWEPWTVFPIERYWIEVHKEDGEPMWYGHPDSTVTSVLYDYNDFSAIPILDNGTYRFVIEVEENTSSLRIATTREVVFNIERPDLIDTDGDGIFDDGDASGVAGDNPCTGGKTTFCDDNCPTVYNPNQADTDGVGIGDACNEQGTNVTVEICLNAWESNYMINASTVPVDASEYSWEVLIDTDNDSSTGDSQGFDVSLSVDHFVLPNSAYNKILPFLDEVQANTWILNPNGGTYGHELNIKKDAESRCITLIGKSSWEELKNIGFQNRFYFRTSWYRDTKVLSDQTDYGYITDLSTDNITEYSVDDSVDDVFGSSSNYAGDIASRRIVDIIKGKIRAKINAVKPTLIYLNSFAAKAENKKVLLSWSTSSEVDNVGFNIFRSETPQGIFLKINQKLIPSQGSPISGSTYEFIDESVVNNKTYYYKLGDVNTRDESTIHNNITSAQPRFLYWLTLPPFMTPPVLFSIPSEISKQTASKPNHVISAAAISNYNIISVPTIPSYKQGKSWNSDLNRYESYEKSFLYPRSTGRSTYNRLKSLARQLGFTTVYEEYIDVQNYCPECVASLLLKEDNSDFMFLVVEADTGFIMHPVINQEGQQGFECYNLNSAGNALELTYTQYESYMVTGRGQILDFGATGVDGSKGQFSSFNMPSANYYEKVLGKMPLEKTGIIDKNTLKSVNEYYRSQMYVAGLTAIRDQLIGIAVGWLPLPGKIGKIRDVSQKIQELYDLNPYGIRDIINLFRKTSTIGREWEAWLISIDVAVEDICIDTRTEGNKVKMKIDVHNAEDGEGTLWFRSEPDGAIQFCTSNQVCSATQSITHQDWKNNTQEVTLEISDEISSTLNNLSNITIYVWFDYGYPQIAQALKLDLPLHVGNSEAQGGWVLWDSVQDRTECQFVAPQEMSIIKIETVIEAANTGCSDRYAWDPYNLSCRKNTNIDYDIITRYKYNSREAGMAIKLLSNIVNMYVGKIEKYFVYPFPYIIPSITQEDYMPVAYSSEEKNTMNSKLYQLKNSLSVRSISIKQHDVGLFDCGMCKLVAEYPFHFDTYPCEPDCDSCTEWCTQPHNANNLEECWDVQTLPPMENLDYCPSRDYPYSRNLIKFNFNNLRYNCNIIDSNICQAGGQITKEDLLDIVSPQFLIDVGKSGQ